MEKLKEAGLEVTPENENDERKTKKRTRNGSLCKSSSS